MPLSGRAQKALEGVKGEEMANKMADYVIAVPTMG